MNKHLQRLLLGLAILVGLLGFILGACLLKEACETNPVLLLPIIIPLVGYFLGYAVLENK